MRCAPGVYMISACPVLNAGRGGDEVRSSKKEIIIRGRLLSEKRVSDVVLRSGTIVAVRCAGKSKADIGSAHAIIAPTLFDIQVNGYGGIDLQGKKVTPEDVRKLTDLLGANGVSHYIPTILTGPQAEMEHGCRVITEALSDSVVRRAVVGIHLEGPYISPVDGPRGAHPKRHVRKPTLREFDRLMKAADGKVAYVTLAPEVPGAIPFIKGLRRRGVLVSLGHHYGDENAIRRAVDAGAQLCTHLGNGMKAEIPRHVNPLWPQLAEDGLTASLIPDLQHLPPAALKTFIRAKGAERTIFTSDVVHIGGMKPGKYDFGRVKCELLPSGRICLSGTELLAGSSLCLLQGLVNAARVTDLSLEQAFACSTTRPARLFGLRHRFRPPRVGKKADLVVFEVDKSKPKWQSTIEAVYVSGRKQAAV